MRLFVAVAASGIAITAMTVAGAAAFVSPLSRPGGPSPFATTATWCRRPARSTRTPRSSRSPRSTRRGAATWSRSGSRTGSPTGGADSTDSRFTLDTVASIPLSTDPLDERRPHVHAAPAGHADLVRHAHRTGRRRLPRRRPRGARLDRAAFHAGLHDRVRRQHHHRTDVFSAIVGPPFPAAELLGPRSAAAGRSRGRTPRWARAVGVRRLGP